MAQYRGRDVTVLQLHKTPEPDRVTIETKELGTQLVPLHEVKFTEDEKKSLVDQNSDIQESRFHLISNERKGKKVDQTVSQPAGTTTTVPSTNSPAVGNTTPAILNPVSTTP